MYAPSWKTKCGKQGSTREDMTTNVPGTLWWSLAHKDVEMVYNCYKGWKLMSLGTSINMIMNACVYSRIHTRMYVVLLLTIVVCATRCSMRVSTTRLIWTSWCRYWKDAGIWRRQTSWSLWQEVPRTSRCGLVWRRCFDRVSWKPLRAQVWGLSNGTWRFFSGNWTRTYPLSMLITLNLTPL